MTRRFDQDLLSRAEDAVVALMTGRGGTVLRRFDRLLSLATPADLARFDVAWRRAHARYAYLGYPKARAGWRGLLSSLPRADRASVSDVLRTCPRAAMLFVQSHDGHVREDALRALPLRPDDTAALTFVLLRCNDWVAPVRAAAFGRLRQALRTATAADLAPLALFVLLQVPIWGRGGAAAAEMVTAQSTWPSALRQHLMSATSGPLARALRAGLRRTDLDGALPDMVLAARSAFVRAVAAEALLTAEARWPEGTEMQYVPNTLRMQRRVTVWGRRPLAVDPDTRARVLRAAATDRSVGVRKLAADHLITVGPAGNETLCTLLAQDKAPAIAERMAYFNRKWHGDRAANTR